MEYSVMRIWYDATVRPLPSCEDNTQMLLIVEYEHPKSEEHRFELFQAMQAVNGFHYWGRPTHRTGDVYPTILRGVKAWMLIPPRIL